MCSPPILTNADVSFCLSRVVITTEGVTKRRGTRKQKRSNPAGLRPCWRRTWFLRLETKSSECNAEKKNFYTTNKVLHFTTGSVCTALSTTALALSETDVFWIQGRFMEISTISEIVCARCGRLLPTVFLRLCNYIDNMLGRRVLFVLLTLLNM